MKKTVVAFVLTTCAVGLTLITIAGSTAAAEMTRCRLTYDLKGWSFLYKTSSGTGRITCSNGQTADVSIVAHGGGVTFGTHEVVDGKGVFSVVSNIDDLYGDYADVDAHASAGRGVDARFLVSKKANLSLSGFGHGITLGFSFGGFRLLPVGSVAT